MATKAMTSYQQEQSDLFFCQGKSDKTYSIQLTESEAGWAVTVQFGRRGSAQQADTKIERADYETAKRIYDKTLREKTAKGYQYLKTAVDAKRQEIRKQFVEGKSTVVSAVPLRGSSVSLPASKEVLFSPELLTRCTENELLAYMRNPRYWFQLKRDGRRLMIRTKQIGKDKWNTICYNKLGQAIQVDAGLREAVESLCNLQCVTGALLDGEIEATGFHVWDILELDHDIRGASYEKRFDVLEGLLKGVTKRLFLVRTAKTTAEKEKLLGWAKANRAEGVVVKDRYAVYSSGRAGNHLKMKFESTASVLVGPKLKANDHRSVGMWLFDKGRKRYMGSVKIADKYRIPEGIIDVRYLYCFQGREGRMYQPVYLGKERDDVRQQDCTTQQLKYRQDVE